MDWVKRNRIQPTVAVAVSIGFFEGESEMQDIIAFFLFLWRVSDIVTYLVEYRWGPFPLQDVEHYCSMPSKMNDTANSKWAYVASHKMLYDSTKYYSFILI